MSGPDPHLPDDHELEDFLAGRGPHRARYRAASGEKAPAALDSSVLAQAQTAVAASSSRKGAIDAGSRWRLPLSLAATVVIGVGLSLRVQREAPVPTPSSIAVAPMEESSVLADAAIASADVASAEMASAPVAGSAPPPPAKPPMPASMPEQRSARAFAPAGPDAVLAEREAAVAAKSSEQRKAEQSRADSFAAPPAIATAPAAPSAARPAPPPMAEAAPEPEMAASGRVQQSGADAPMPASPPVVAPMAAPPAEARSKRRAFSAAAPTASAFAAGDYLSVAGGRLRLLADQGFVLERGEVRLTGRRVAHEAGERLLPTSDPSPDCALLIGFGPEPETLTLEADCDRELAGLYRRLRPPERPASGIDQSVVPGSR